MMKIEQQAYLVHKSSGPFRGSKLRTPILVPLSEKLFQYPVLDYSNDQ